jgi:hypothetical protein
MGYTEFAAKFFSCGLMRPGTFANPDPTVFLHA